MNGRKENEPDLLYAITYDLFYLLGSRAMLHQPRFLMACMAPSMEPTFIMRPTCVMASPPTAMFTNTTTKHGK